MLVTTDEHVVLLDDERRPCGTALKSEVHTTATPLHLAFSVYLIVDDQVLLSQRALSKRTFPGVWSNSCCGHPAPGEPLDQAVRRRVREELGLEVTDLVLRLPDFAYRAVDSSGIVENEHCPVFTARPLGTPALNRTEVEAVRWVSFADLDPTELSPWAQLQVAALKA